MRILGIDPGTRVTGYAIIEVERDSEHVELLEIGECKLTLEDTMPKKVMRFYKFFKKAIHQKQIDVLAIETPFMGRNAKTFLKLGCLKGILYLLGYECTIFEFSPPEVKKIVGGKGNLSKKELANEVKKYVPLFEVKSTDVSDALAVALSAMLTLRI